MNSIFSKLKNIAFVTACLAYGLIRGDAKKVPGSIKTIVVFRIKKHIGDMVYVTPLFKAIKKTYPDSRVVLVGLGRTLEVIKHNPDIDKVIDYKQGFFKSFLELRPEKIDFACVCNLGSLEGISLLFLAGAACISTFSYPTDERKPRLFGLVEKLLITTRFSKGVYVPPLYLSLLGPIAANTGDVHFRLYFSTEDQKKIEDLFRDNAIDPKANLLVGIAPGGSTEDRWWPAERFARIAEYLYKNYNAKIFLIGAGKDEKAMSGMLASIDPSVSCVNLINQPLGEFKATVSKMAIMIGNDSGPMVTSDAFDVPNIALVGPTDPREYHLPSSLKSRVITGNGGQVSLITTAEVIEGIEILLHNRNSNV